MKTINLNNKFNNSNYFLNANLKACLETEVMGFEFEKIKGGYAVKSTISNNELFLKIIEDKKLNVKQLDNYYFLINKDVYKLSGALEYFKIAAVLSNQFTNKQFENIMASHIKIN